MVSGKARPVWMFGTCDIEYSTQQKRNLCGFMSMKINLISSNWLFKDYNTLSLFHTLQHVCIALAFSVVVSALGARCSQAAQAQWLWQCTVDIIFLWINTGEQVVLRSMPCMKLWKEIFHFVWKILLPTVNKTFHDIPPLAVCSNFATTYVEESSDSPDIFSNALNDQIQPIVDPLLSFNMCLLLGESSREIDRVWLKV